MKRPIIRIENLNDKYRIDRKFVKGLALKILGHVRLQRGRAVEIDVIFVSDSGIKPINKRFKGDDRPTDVLSFDMSDARFRPGVFSGEIYISSGKAASNSGIYGTKFEEELILYVIHGILHLFGYDDESAKKRVVMERKQAKILRGLCQTANLSRVLMRR